MKVSKTKHARWGWSALVVAIICASTLASLPPAVRAADSGPITFDELPNGTTVTDQYRSVGVDFSARPVFIASDGSNPTSPVLSGTPQFVGAIEFSVVDPITGLASSSFGFTLDVGYIDNRNSVQISSFGLDGQLVHSVRANALAINTIDVQVLGVHRVVVEAVATEAAGFAIDNLVIRRGGAGVVPRSMIMFGDSYSSGEGLLPEDGLHYDCGTDIAKGTYAENTTARLVVSRRGVFFAWSNLSCDTRTGSTGRPADLQTRLRKTYENKCHRHGRAYPNQLRSRLNITGDNAIFLACSGAVTGNVGAYASYATWPSYPNSPNRVAGGELQFENATDFTDVNGPPDLITIGIGGNDAGFKDLLVTCLRENCLEKVGFQSDVRLRIDAEVYPKLVDTFAAIRNRFPTATIAAFGYPSVFAKDLDCAGVHLGPLYNITAEEREWAQTVLLPSLNTAISDAAATIGLTYVDIFGVTKNNVICSESEWVNGLRLGDDIYGIVRT